MNLLYRWSREDSLASSEPILYEKIRLLCVMEMTFRRDTKDRQLTFENVAKETGHGVDLVELLVRVFALPEVKKAQVIVE